ELRQIFKARDFDDWNTFLPTVEVSWAPVLDMAEGFDHPHATAREMLIDDGIGGRVVGTPVKFADEPGEVHLRAPTLDADGASIRATGWARS
ncbi:MAG: CoA transferase, partial [Sphingosinicella sp.]|nr:CoA transferase [Sphingosinicella sp.]